MSGVDTMETDYPSLKSRLFVAVNNSDEKEVERLLFHKEINVHSKVKGPLTCIHVAVEKGLVNICELLIKNGANVNHRYPVADDRYTGSTLLYRAASKGYAAVVELLLKFGAEIDAGTTDGSTSLHIAAEKNFPQIVKTLVENGAEINMRHSPIGTMDHYQKKCIENNLIRDTLKLDIVDVSSISVYEGKFTPLHVAVKKGHEEIVKLLLESGASVDIPDDNGDTALSLAALKGCFRMLNHILNHFPDKNLVGNRRALAHAVKFKGEIYQNIIQKLLDYGLLYDDELFQHDYFHRISVKKLLPLVPFNLQRTFPDMAAENGHFSVVRRLMRDNPSAQLNLKSCASRCLLVSINSGSEDDIKFFLDCDADVNSRDLCNRDLPLLQAVRKANVRIAKLLIKSGADVRADSRLLITAVDSGCLEMVKLLLNECAEVNKITTVENQNLRCVSKWRRYSSLHENHTGFSDWMVSPLFIAASVGDEDLVQFLLDKGATIGLKSAKGLTPLLISVVCGQLEIAELLLKSGASIDCVDHDGRTALHIASEFGHKDVIKLLLRFGAKIEALIPSTQSGDVLTPLLFAAKNGHQGAVKTLLDCGARVDFSLEGSVTALGLAAEYGHAAVVETLLEHGASINYKFKDGMTALFYAIEGGHVETVEKLLEHGANINIIDYNVEHPLQIAIRRKSDKIVKLLLDYGAESKEVDLYEKETCLRGAVISGNLKIVEAFTKKGVNLDHPTLVADALLSEAVKNGQIEIAKLLFDNGIRFNSDMERDQAFLTSAERGCLDAFEFLLECGARIHFANSNGETALHFAARSGNFSIMKLLLAHELDVNATSSNDTTPLILSAITETPIKSGTCLETADYHGRTALFSAAEWDHLDMLRLLIDCGADINCRAKNGETPVLIAAKRGHFGILEFLIKCGGNVNASNIDGETALYFATEHGKVNAVKLLLENGAIVNSAAKTGSTPIFISAKRGHLEIIDILLKFGANVNFTDQDGFTPLLYAVESGHADVVELLLEHGADVCCDTRDHVPLLLMASKHESSLTTVVLLEFGVTFELFKGHKRFLSSYFSCASSNREKFNGFASILLCGSGDSNFVSERTVDVLFNVISNNYRNSLSNGTSYVCRRLAKIVERFYVQMKASGLYNDLKISNSEPFTYRSTHIHYEAECRRELAVMRSDFIDGFESGVTVYDILTSTLSRLASMARNPRVSPYLMSPDFNEKYPKYRAVVRSQFKKGALRRKWLNQCIRSLYSSCRVFSSLSIDILENILLHLNNQNLRVLIRACSVTQAHRVHHRQS